MIPPRKVRIEAAKKENENLAFRTFLKCNAREDVLDAQFAQLHEELFSHYDCSRCRNCCKMYCGAIPEEDLDRDAQYLHMSREELIDTYLVNQPREDGYPTKHMPCDFLKEDGSCLLGECKPENCQKYPYTNQPERLWSLYSVLEAVETCPVAFEIFERLKKEYHFRHRGR